MLYNKKQSDLLKESIIKWEGIVNRTKVDRGTKNCVLCKKYYDNDCKGCPIYEFTDFTDCYNTPYWDWVDSTDVEDIPYENTNDKTQKAAEDELEFLKSLLEDLT